LQAINLIKLFSITPYYDANKHSKLTAEYGKDESIDLFSLLVCIFILYDLSNHILPIYKALRFQAKSSVKIK
jgi:hypothetical protein